MHKVFVARRCDVAISTYKASKFICSESEITINKRMLRATNQGEAAIMTSGSSHYHWDRLTQTTFICNGRVSSGDFGYLCISGYVPFSDVVPSSQLLPGSGLMSTQTNSVGPCDSTASCQPSLPSAPIQSNEETKQRLLYLCSGVLPSQYKHTNSATKGLMRQENANATADDVRARSYLHPQLTPANLR